MNQTTLKLVLLLTFYWTIVLPLTAQAPEAINYQAVARNAAGATLANQAITVRFGIYSGAMAATQVYEETHNTITNVNGLFNLPIGRGTVISGTFATINWGSNAHHLRVEVNTGAGFVNLGTVQLLSVPYALYAKNSGNGFTLPFVGSVNSAGNTTLDITNSTLLNGVAIVGRQGTGATIAISNAAGIFGTASTGHGVVGLSSGNGTFAGVLGRNNNNNGIGVQGVGSGGAVGGFFEANDNGPALITGTGNVGIGVPNPDEKLVIGGTLRVNTNVGGLEMGHPNNGNLWRFSTINGGEDLQLFSKPTGINTATRRFIFKQDGRLGLGDNPDPHGKLSILHNSTTAEPHLMLTESAADFVRIQIRNTTISDYWSITGINSAMGDASSSLSFGRSNRTGIFSVYGNGNIIAQGDFRLIHNTVANIAGSDGRFGLTIQNGDAAQGLGSGATWNFYVNPTTGDLALYNGTLLRARIDRGDGSYTAISDERLKTNIQPLSNILSMVLRLMPRTYQYKDQESNQKSSIGFVAQEVEKLFPQFIQKVDQTGDDTYTLNYAGFSVIAIKAIQEQQQLIEKQQQTIDNLMKRMEALEKMVTKNQKN